MIVQQFIGHSEPTTLTNEVIEPDILLSNSRTYFEQDAYHRSMEHLARAIEAIKRIEQDIDEDSKYKVDMAINGLNDIYRSMSQDTFNIDQLNNASIKALNALTFAELKVTEHFVESHELNKAQVALHYGILHIKNALTFAQGYKKEYEIKIYKELDSLIENHHLSDEELIKKLEHMIGELDDIRLNSDTDS